MVYGPPEYLPVDESHPTNPPGPYGQSKILAEKTCFEGDSADFAVCVFRPRKATSESGVQAV